jgi:hypothetical protein
MFPAFGLTLILMVPSAPVPKVIAPVGPAPYILNLKADDDGNISFPVTRTRRQTCNVFLQGPGGFNLETCVVDYGKGTVLVGLADLKDLKVYTAYGQEMIMLEATRKLENNLRVVVSSDGKKVDPTYLSQFKDNELILVTPELAKIKTASIPVVPPAEDAVPVGWGLWAAPPPPPPLVAPPVKKD